MDRRLTDEQISVARAVARAYVAQWERERADPILVYPYRDPAIGDAQLLARALLEATDECDESSPRGDDGVRRIGPIEE